MAAGAVDRLRGWKTVTRTEDGGVVTVAAEKGYLRETGNLIFHAALVVLLVGVALGKLWGYQGTVLLTEGQPGICNAVPLYDSFRPGKLVDGSGLAPFCIDSLDKFSVDYDPDGTPAQFRGDITYSLGEDGAERKDVARGQPPAAGGGRPGLPRRPRLRPPIHGHASRTAPVVKDLSAPFLPQNASTLLSEGAVKLLDTVKPQLALYGTFAPFAALGSGREVDVVVATARQPRGRDPDLPR